MQINTATKPLVYTISENGKATSLDDKLVIFPRYVKCLVENNVSVVVQGDRIAERKLTSMMMSWIMYPERKVPDIALFDVNQREWVYFFVKEDCTFKMRRKGYDYLEYFPSLMDDVYNPVHMNMLKNFVKVYSSAKVSIR